MTDLDDVRAFPEQWAFHCTGCKRHFAIRKGPAIGHLLGK